MKLSSFGMKKAISFNLMLGMIRQSLICSGFPLGMKAQERKETIVSVTEREKNLINFFRFFPRSYQDYPQECGSVSCVTSVNALLLCSAAMTVFLREICSL